MSRQLVSTERNHDWIYRDELARLQTTIETQYLLTRFNQSLHPRGMTTGAPLQPQQRPLYDPGITPPSPCESVAISSWLQQQPPLILGCSGYRVWHGLYPILLMQLKSHCNRTVQIFDTISNKFHLGEYSTTLNLWHLVEFFSTLMCDYLKKFGLGRSWCFPP
jgi:hypothetical protein